MEKTFDLLHSTTSVSSSSLLNRDYLLDYVENAAIALHWVDANGIIRWANKAELDMLGYSEEEYFGHHIAEFHTEKEKIEDILCRLSRNETLRNYESCLRCKDGTLKHVSISSNVLMAGGKFIHTRCFTIDIDRLKKTQEDLEKSEARYRQLVENMPTAMYTVDINGFITMYNAAAVELWGREPIIGVDRWCGAVRVLNPDGTEAPAGKYPIAIAINEGRQVFDEEVILVRPDGDFRYVKPYPQPMFDNTGKIIGATNMLVDVTDMKRSEEALKKSEKKYRDLSESLEKKIEEQTSNLKKKNEQLKKSEERYHKMIEEVEDYAILLLDRSGIIQNWNAGAEKIKGYKEDEIVGKSFNIFYLPEDRKKGLPEQLINIAIREGKSVHEGWRLRKNGTIFWGWVVITSLHDAEGNIIGFSKLTRDLSDKKIAEDKIRDYAKELEFQNAELEQFAYAASHDLKEPLRKIHFYNSYIIDNCSAELSEKAREYINRSIISCKRMQRLIDDILSYAKNTVNLNLYEETDLNELAEEVLLMHKDELEQLNVSIEIGRLPVVQAIPFQIKQLIDNLISNSIKYKHPERGCKIRISSMDVQGQEVYHKDADPVRPYFRICFEDNGIGFEEKHGEKIFEIFQRLQAKTESSGSGIGLAICKKIIQNHNGFIRAKGSPNEGACFEVYLPQKQ